MSIKNNSIPIYKQIIEFFEYDIASSKLAPGSKIDSIRELAASYKVNPNTIVRALSELEANGLIYTDRTNGKFICEDKSKIKQLKDSIAYDDANTYIRKTRSLKLSKDEVKALINKLLEENYA